MKPEPAIFYQKKYWPLGLRIIHWGLAFPVLLNLFFLEEGDPPHRWLGYLAFVFLCLRWFYFKKRPEVLKKAQLNLSPSQLKMFLSLFFRRKSYKKKQGHDPLASWVYVLMFCCICILTGSGFLRTLDMFWGNIFLEDIHYFSSQFLQILLCVHLCGVLIDSLRFRRSTYFSMFSGEYRKWRTKI